MMGGSLLTSGARRGPARRLHLLVGALVVLGVVGALAAPPSWGVATSAGSRIANAPAAPTAHAPLRAASHAVTEARAAAHPAATSTNFNPPCYKIDTTVCVSIQNQNMTDIIPPVGTFVSSQEPNTSSDIVLVIKSHTSLNWSSSAPHYGPDSPIALNVTGNLWNGDPYYSLADGTTWHSNSATNWWGSLPYVSQNLTYPYQYSVVFSARSSAGAPNFFAGMTVHWWIYLTYNVSINSTVKYVHHVSPVFQFIYAGAWPYSPYPGSSQYAGTSAAGEDVNITVTPRQPNFNDSVKVVLNTTQADVLTNATVGQNSYLDLTEVAGNGSVIATDTLLFPVAVSGGFGATTTSVTIPATFAQQPNATVTYTISIRDVSNDLLVLPAQTYLVGGNGTFLSGVFTDDIELDTTPTSVAAEPQGQAMLAPGAPLNITLISRNPGTAISAAEVFYTVSYPLLHETVVLSVQLTRISSIRFIGTIPGLPLASFVNFTVDAWDFSQRLEVSPGYGYFTPDLQTDIPLIPGNQSFFYVFVYDNGSHSWVTGAMVQIVGFGGVYNTVANTTIGVAYPNQTFAHYTPLLVVANASYKITVNDPWFVPPGGAANKPDVNVTILATHTMTSRETLYAGPNYAVVQEGNAIVFWLNATPPTADLSPSVSSSGSIPLAAVLGIVAAAVVSIPVIMWWSRIRARRKEEEKRVTL